MAGGKSAPGCPDDCPNWRRVPGFPIFGVGQPTQQGFLKLAQRIPQEKIVWFNLRQEPVAYINGQPVTPRKTKNPHGNLEVQGKVSDMDALEVNTYRSVQKLHSASTFSMYF